MTCLILQFVKTVYIYFKNFIFLGIKRKEANILHMYDRHICTKIVIFQEYMT